MPADGLLCGKAVDLGVIHEKRWLGGGMNSTVDGLEKLLVRLGASDAEGEEDIFEQFLDGFAIQREGVLPVQLIGIGHEVEVVASITQLSDLDPCCLRNTGVDGIPGIDDLLFGGSGAAMPENRIDETARAELADLKSVAEGIAAVIAQAKQMADIIIGHQLPEGLQATRTVMLHKHPTKIEDYIPINHTRARTQ